MNNPFQDDKKRFSCVTRYARRMFYHIVAWLVSRAVEKAEFNSGDVEAGQPRAVNAAKRTVGNNRGIEWLSQQDPEKVAGLIYVLLIAALIVTCVVVLWGTETNEDTYPVNTVLVMVLILFMIVMCGFGEAIIITLSQKAGYDATFRKRLREDGPRTWSASVDGSNVLVDDDDGL